MLRFGAVHRGSVVIDAEMLTLTFQRDDRRKFGASSGYPGMPENRELTIVIHNWTADTRSVRIGDQPVGIDRRLPDAGPGAGFDTRKKRLTLRLDWNHQPLDIVIE